jgi:hypothetical protein
MWWPYVCLWQQWLLMDHDEMSNRIEDLPKMLPTNCRFIWRSGFRGKDFCFWLANFKRSSPLKPLGQMNWNVVGSIYGRSSIKLHISSWSVNKHGCHRQFLFLIGRFKKKILLLFVNGSERNVQSW